MAFFYGTGCNGKSVLLDTVAGMMGDYHTTAPIETFTVSSSDRHPTELADLVGARLVTAIETEKGRAWAEARIKTLTGGDRVKARFMRQNFFEFKPQFKLVIAGNHQPTLSTVDEAIKRRFNLVPFAVTIPPEQRDPKLAEKLRAEWPAILRWLIDGCLIWQRDRLNPPAAVTDATATYLEGQDALSAWLDERCETRPSHQERASRLYASWKAYADRMGETAGSSKTFGPLLEGKGFPKKHTMAGNVYVGLRLKEDEG
jgi:putative DNA primase/helicase